MARCSRSVVSDLALIREHYFSNKFVGFVEVKINGDSYYPNVVVYMDKVQWFSTMGPDVCEIARIKRLR